eukprot:m.354047 g.354047  ORF g.354047 m.354047 type:complete len:79 (+) comp16908_c0_seq1:1503-1739(+)
MSQLAATTTSSSTWVNTSTAAPEWVQPHNQQGFGATSLSVLDCFCSCPVMLTNGNYAMHQRDQYNDVSGHKKMQFVVS